jgi:uncharacterized protein involved in response to NO
MFSAGFRPFFLLAGLWSAIAIPVWLCAHAAEMVLPSALPPVLWHAHEMIYGYALASVAGFLLTAIPNWTGRLPLRGMPLAALAFLWFAGRVAVLLSGSIGAPAAALVDLSFPVALIAVVAREILAGRNWRNLPMVAALSLLAAGSLLVHLHATGLAYTAELGNRLGVATLSMLIALVGGRIVPSFTRNWLARTRPRGRIPAPESRLDYAALAVTLAALAGWVAAPQGLATPWLALAAGTALAVRLSRWCGWAVLREPLLFVLHAGYAWLAFGLFLLGLNGLTAWVPASAALHALTVGAVGTMTLAVMTRATLGHSGQPLAAGGGTIAIYLLVTLAALLRVAVPMAGTSAVPLTWLAGAAWSASFLLFVLLYRVHLTQIKSIPD